jgi:hypothetical protein
MKKYDCFCTDSRKNGLPEAAGKDAYPLHKIISEDKTIETKYGTNGLAMSKPTTKKY